LSMDKSPCYGNGSVIDSKGTRIILVLRFFVNGKPGTEAGS
jgi:hypothetical protein